MLPQLKSFSFIVISLVYDYHHGHHHSQLFCVTFASVICGTYASECVRSCLLSVDELDARRSDQVDVAAQTADLADHLGQGQARHRVFPLALRRVLAHSDQLQQVPFQRPHFLLDGRVQRKDLRVEETKIMIRTLFTVSKQSENVASTNAQVPHSRIYEYSI